VLKDEVVMAGLRSSGWMSMCLATLIAFAGATASAAPKPSSKEEFKKITKAPQAPTAQDEVDVDEGDTSEGAYPPKVSKRAVKPVRPAKGEKSKTPKKKPVPKSETTMNETDAILVAKAPPLPKAEPAVKAVVPASATVPAAAHAAAPAPAHDAHAAPASASVPADQSLKWLSNGNVRFMKRAFRADGRMAADRKRLLGGQRPHAVVLSCADSRVPPELVFDQALGEIFTIRVAGEALDSSVIASVEYAIAHLGPRLLVVMGHTQCGAVDAALKFKEGQTVGSEALDKLAADIRPRLKTVTTEKTSPNLEVESALNADGVARDLVKRSDIVRKKVESGELVIKAALYRMDSGKVSFY
jgi:carbonic anhydrase